MSILGDLFSSKTIIDTAAKGVESAISGIDMLVFTDEEKSITNQKLLDWKLKYLEATGAQNLARRYIAVVVTALWAFMVSSYVILGVFGLDEQAKFIYTALNDIVNPPFMIVAAFYFLAHVVGRSK